MTTAKELRVMGEKMMALAASMEAPATAPAPTVTPWTLETVPMPLVFRSKATGVRAMAVAADERGITVVSNTMGDTRTVTYATIMQVFTRDDGSPCGEVAK